MVRKKGSLASKAATQLIRDESGATAVEYGMMIAAIAAVIILVVISVGSEVNGTFTFVNNGLDALTP